MQSRKNFQDLVKNLFHRTDGTALLLEDVRLLFAKNAAKGVKMFRFCLRLEN